MHQSACQVIYPKIGFINNEGVYIYARNHLWCWWYICILYVARTNEATYQPRPHIWLYLNYICAVLIILYSWWILFNGPVWNNNCYIYVIERQVRKYSEMSLWNTNYIVPRISLPYIYTAKLRCTHAQRTSSLKYRVSIKFNLLAIIHSDYGKCRNFTWEPKAHTVRMYNHCIAFAPALSAKLNDITFARPSK